MFDITFTVVPSECYHPLSKMIHYNLIDYWFCNTLIDCDVWITEFIGHEACLMIVGLD